MQIAAHRRLQRGFSLVELLVALAMLGLLAAIAIPVFMGQRSRGQEAAAKSLVRSAASTVESAYADTRDYAAIDVARLRAIEPGIAFDATENRAQDGQVAFTAAADGYTLSTETAAGTTWAIIRSASGVARTCAPADRCHDGGTPGRW